MATSNTFNFAVTTYDIITLAAKYLGKLGEGETLTPSEYKDCLYFLNLVVRQYAVNSDSSSGLKTWLRHQGYMFLNASSGTYNLAAANGSYWTENFLSLTSSGNNAIGANVINISSSAGILANDTIGIQTDDGQLYWSTVIGAAENLVAITGALPAPAGNNNVIYDFTNPAQPPQIIESVILRDSTGNDTPVRVINLQDYMMLPSKQAGSSNYGDPFMIYPEFHLIGTGADKHVKIFTDVSAAQDVSKYLVISYLQAADDFTMNLNENICFPAEWEMALVLNLAKHTAPMFNAVWTNQQEEMAKDAITYARKGHKKTSTRGFAPGFRGLQTEVLWR